MQDNDKKIKTGGAKQGGSYKAVRRRERKNEMKQGKKLAAFLLSALCALWAAGPVSAEIPGTTDGLAAFVEHAVTVEKNIVPESVLSAAQEAGYSATQEEIAARIDSEIQSREDEIFTQTGEYIQTYGMLNRPLNEISFAGTHNSYSNNVDGSGYTYLFYGGTQNHDLGIRQMLDRGIRYIEVDIGNSGWLGRDVACYHRIAALGKTEVSAVAEAVRGFLEENPNEFVYLRICEAYEGGLSVADVQAGTEEYESLVERFMEEIRKAGLLDQVSNYYGSLDSVDINAMMKPGKTYEGREMESWPTLKEMIQSGKRLIIEAKEINSTVVQAEPPANQEHGNVFSVAPQMWGDENSFVVISQCADHGSTAGWRACSVINGDGRRAYEQMKYFENTENAVGYCSVTNVVMIDFFYGAERKGGNLLCDVDIVDAVNRMNLEREGIWSEEIGDLYWTTDPLTDRTPEAIEVYDAPSETLLPTLSDGLLWQSVESASEDGRLSYLVRTEEPVNPYALAINFLPWNGKSHVVPDSYDVYYKNADGEYVLLGSAVPHDHNQSWNVMTFGEPDVTADEFKVVVNGREGKWFVVTEIALYANS